jgi:hypothetical protein
VIRKLVPIGLVCVTLLILIYTNPVWTRYPGGRWILLIGLLIVVGFVWLIVKLIKEIIRLIKNRKTFKANHLLPTILIIGVFCFIFFNKFSFDIEDKIYGKVVFRACHEGALRFGDRIFMDNQKEVLTIIRQGNDSLKNVIPFYFYYGYCKGLN